MTRVAELTWEATSPLSAEMYFGVYATSSCGGEGIEYRSLADVGGPSPLAVDRAQIVLEEGETGITLYANTPAIDQDPIHAFGRIDQPFSFTGEFTEEVLAP